MSYSKLCSGKQFRAVYDRGQRFHSPYFSAFFLVNKTGEARLGITVTRKVGKAVLRNFCKRRLRSLFQQHHDKVTIGPGFDLVINAKTELASASFPMVETAFLQTLRRFQIFLQQRIHDASVGEPSPKLGQSGGVV